MSKRKLSFDTSPQPTSKVAKTRSQHEPASAPIAKTTTDDKVAKAGSENKNGRTGGSRFLMDDITINIAVGPSAASFVIHKKLLIQYSGYFTNMLKDKETHGYDFPEGRAKTCVMAEASADAFSYVQEWIYRQDIEQVGDITTAPGTERAEKCSPSAVMYADIYRLADYLNRPELQDFVMTRLYKAFDQLGGKKYQMGHLIKPCCEDTVQGYAPKRWISALFALGVGVMSYKKAEELTCQDFLFETFRLRQADVQKQDIPPGSVHVKELPHLYYYDLGRYLFKKPKSVAQKNLDADAQEAQGDK